LLSSLNLSIARINRKRAPIVLYLGAGPNGELGSHEGLDGRDGDTCIERKFWRVRSFRKDVKKEIRALHVRALGLGARTAQPI